MSTSDSDFEITVIASDHNNGLGLSAEVRSVKAALLYADHVTLVSPKLALYPGGRGRCG